MGCAWGRRGRTDSEIETLTASEGFYDGPRFGLVVKDGNKVVLELMLPSPPRCSGSSKASPTMEKSSQGRALRIISPASDMDGTKT